MNIPHDSKVAKMNQWFVIVLALAFVALGITMFVCFAHNTTYGVSNTKAVAAVLGSFTVAMCALARFVYHSRRARP